MSCTPPARAGNVRVTDAWRDGRQTYTSFTAVLPSGSGCGYGAGVTRCTWEAAPARVAQLLWGPVTDDCRYDPRPDRTSAFRYGCSLDVAAGPLDGTDGWRFSTVSCVADAQLSVGALRPMPCSDPAAPVAAVARSARLVRSSGGAADLDITAAVPHLPTGPDLRGVDVRAERLLVEGPEGVADELVTRPSDAPFSVAPLTSLGAPSRDARYALARRSPPRDAVRRLFVRLEDGPRRDRIVIRARDVRVDLPEACHRGATRVRLETRLRIGDRGRPAAGHLSLPIRTTWRCVRGRGGEVVGLRFVA